MERIAIPRELEPFINEIIFLENDVDTLFRLPIYADGFAGIAFSKSARPAYLMPKRKLLSNFYLFGQTIEPMQLEVQGAYKLVALRLYPYVVRILLNVSPKELNDDCYDLRQIKYIDTEKTIEQLNTASHPETMIDVLIQYFNKLLKKATSLPNHRITLATNLIIKENGKITIKEVRDRLYISERTFERHFLKEIGVTPKQFAKIIQFSASVKQITEDDYVNLTEIGYDNGFADQSHFIRTFKRYTGRTPKEMQRQLAY